MSGSERERKGTLFFCLFWFNKTRVGGDVSKVRKILRRKIRFGGTLSLSLSLSLGFCCRFSSNSSHPGKRQTDRQSDRQTDRETERRMSLSLSLSRSFGISRREFDVSFFQERIETPPQLLSNNYWRRRRPGNLITR